MYHYLLCVDWQQIVYQNASAIEAWDVFINVIYSAVDLFVPKYPTTAPTNLAFTLARYKNSPAKNTSSGKGAETVHRTACYANYIVIVLANGGMKSTVWRWKRRTKLSNQITLAYSISSFVNKRFKYRNVIGALVDDSGDIITNDDDKANLLNDHFGSVGVVRIVL